MADRSAISPFLGGPCLGMKNCAGCTTPNFLHGTPNALGQITWWIVCWQKLRGDIRKRLYGNREIVVYWTVGVWDSGLKWAHSWNKYKRSKNTFGVLSIALSLASHSTKLLKLPAQSPIWSPCTLPWSGYFSRSLLIVSLRWGWVFLERTRILSGIQFTTYFIEILVVETKQFVSSFVHVILTRQTCGQRSSRAAESKGRVIRNYFSERICYVFRISKCRGDWDLGLCPSSFLSFPHSQRNGKIRFFPLQNTFFFPDFAMALQNTKRRPKKYVKP